MSDLMVICYAIVGQDLQFCSFLSQRPSPYVTVILYDIQDICPEIANIFQYIPCYSLYNFSCCTMYVDIGNTIGGVVVKMV